MNIFSSARAWIKRLSGRESVRHLGLIYSSRFITAIMRFGASIVVARALGAERLGILVIASVIMGIAQRFLQMGMTTTMIRKMAFHLEKGEEDLAVGLFRRIFLLKIIAATAFVIAAWFAAPRVAAGLYGNPSLTAPLRIAAFGAFIWGLWDHADGTLRTLEKFKAIAVINVVSHAVRTGLILLVAWRWSLNVEQTLLLNLAQIFIAFAAASMILPRMFIKGKGRGEYSFREIFAYSKWIYLFSLLFILFDRLDVLMLGYFKQEKEVGLYSLAFLLIRPLELIPESLNTVFLPKVSRFTTKLQIYRYFKDTLKITGLVGLCCILLIFAARPLIIGFYGHEFEASIRLFQILIGAYILLTIINPLNLVGHSINKPQLFVVMVSINLILNFTGNMIFIPRYGATGAAVVTLVSRVLGSVIGLSILWKYLQRWNEEK